MGTFADIDTATPPNSDPLSDGALEIRTLKENVKTGFDVEHALTGQHKLPYGTTVARPAAATAGRLYLNSDEGQFERDDSAAWSGFGLKAKVLLDATVLLGAGANTDITIQTLAAPDHAFYIISVYVPGGAADVYEDHALGLAATAFSYSLWRDIGAVNCVDKLRLYNDSAAPQNVSYKVVQVL